MSKTTTNAIGKKQSIAVAPLEIAKQQRVEKILDEYFDAYSAEGTKKNLSKLTTVFKYTSGASDDLIEDMDLLAEKIFTMLNKLESLKGEFAVLTQLH